MTGERNLAEITRDISNRLLNSKYIVETLAEITENEAKTDFLLSTLKDNICSAFWDTEECRQKICIID